MMTQPNVPIRVKSKRSTTTNTFSAMRVLLAVVFVIAGYLALNILPRNANFAPEKASAAAVYPSLPSAAGIPRPDHVIVVVEENHAYGEIIGSPSAPYINSLAGQGALFTNSHGVTHPSQPNYLYLYSGSNQDTVADECPPAGVPFTTANLGASLITATLTFTGYSEDLPATGSTVCQSGKYFRKHNPWSNFGNVPTTTNQTFVAFPADYTTLPTVGFVIPNQDHDMHDGTIGQADTWLHDNLDGYKQWAMLHNSLLVITWDEDDNSTTNDIPTIFVGPMVVQGQYSELINHLNVLRTFEDMYDLPYAGMSANVQPITDVWVGANTPTATSTATATACVISFADVPANNTFYPYVRCLSCRGVMGGYPCGAAGEPCNSRSEPYFRPGNNISRGQISKIVAEAAGFSNDPGSQIYEDVAPSSPFYNWVNRLSRLSYMGGYPCGGPGEACNSGARPYFRPGANATRGQLSKIVSNAAQFSGDTGEQLYSDVPPDSPFYAWIQRLSSRSVMSGYPCGGVGEACDAQSRPYFRPTATVTRGQASKIVTNTFFPACSPAARR